MYMTVNQAAERLALHPMTIRRWCQTGVLTGAHLKFGRRKLGYLIPLATIEALERGESSVNGQEALSAGLESDQSADQD